MTTIQTLSIADLDTVTGGRKSASSQEEIKTALKATSDAVKELVSQGNNKNGSMDQMMPLMMMMMMRR